MKFDNYSGQPVNQEVSQTTEKEKPAEIEGKQAIAFTMTELALRSLTLTIYHFPRNFLSASLTVAAAVLMIK